MLFIFLIEVESFKSLELNDLVRSFQASDLDDTLRRLKKWNKTTDNMKLMILLNSDYIVDLPKVFTCTYKLKMMMKYTLI